MDQEIATEHLRSCHFCGGDEELKVSDNPFRYGRYKGNMEFQDNGALEIVERQDTTPYHQSNAVDEILRKYPEQCTLKVAVSLYMTGFIEGKQADRARRNKARLKEANPNELI